MTAVITFKLTRYW